MRGAKLLLATAFYWLGGLWLVRLLNRILTPPAIRILYAHRVHPDGPEAGDLLTVSKFEERVRHLVRRYRVISMADAASQMERGAIARRNQVVVTFDDGFADNLEACRILRQYGVPATIYVATGATDSREPLWFVVVHRAFERTARTHVPLPWGDAVLPLETKGHRRIAAATVIAAMKKMPAEERARCVREVLAALDVDPPSVADPRDRMLYWSEIRDLAAYGLFTFGAHTVTHQILSATSAESAAREIERSTADLLRLGGIRPTTFAYPNGKAGDYLPHHKSLLRGFGYVSACTTEPGMNGAGSDLFALRREPFYEGKPLRAFALRMAGMNEILDRLRRMLPRLARRATPVSRARRGGRATLGGRP